MNSSGALGKVTFEKFERAAYEEESTVANILQNGWDGDPTSAYDCECGEVIEDPKAEACEGCLGCDDSDGDPGEDGPPSSRNYSHPHSYGFDIEV